jgi:hypothetical protein
MKAPNELIGLLFHSRDAMHLAHLNTTSFAEHKALGGYYDDILDLTDKFTEVYFGRYKRLAIIIPEAKVEGAVEHLKGLQQIIDAERGQYSSELQNILDEMLAVINRTLYLLTLV